MSGVMSDNKNVAMIVVVVVVVLAFYWLRKREGFDGEMAVAPKVAVEAVPVAANSPALKVNVGAIVDGPGMENSPVGVVSAFRNDTPDNFYFLDDGSNGAMSVQNNLCSPACCGQQWNNPAHQKNDPYVCAALKNETLVPSRMFCNSTFLNSGCMCLNKNQARFLYTRGGQGGEFF